jgi:hypothetical protein
MTAIPNPWCELTNFQVFRRNSGLDQYDGGGGGDGALLESDDLIMKMRRADDVAEKQRIIRTNTSKEKILSDMLLILTDSSLESITNELKMVISVFESYASATQLKAYANYLDSRKSKSDIIVKVGKSAKLKLEKTLALARNASQILKPDGAFDSTMDSTVIALQQIMEDLRDCQTTLHAMDALKNQMKAPTFP